MGLLDKHLGYRAPLDDIRSAGADPFNEGCAFDEVEKDIENGWLNVRVNRGDWGSVREFARIGFDRARQGRIPNAPSAGGATDRPPFFDPLAELG